MGLEVTTYISGLNTSWPLPGDFKTQGDDHIRLIKSVLTASFPTASRPFYIPTTEAFSTTIALDVTDQNNLIMVDTTGGDISCTLPVGLTAADKGWETEIVRTNTAGGNNGIMVSAAAGNINSVSGATATIRIERIWEPVRFKWTGAAWFCVKPGIPVGASMNWDGSAIQPGFRAADGTAYSPTTFAELNSVLGTATLKDKRGRVEAGLDNGSVNRLTATYFGTASVLGAVGGLESDLLTSSTIPSHNHTATDSGHVHTVSHNANMQTASSTGGGAFTIAGYAAASIGLLTGFANISVANVGSGNSHKNVQPTIVTNKLVRVC